MDGDFGDFAVGLLFMPLRPEEERDNGDVFGVGHPLPILLLFTLLFTVAGGMTASDAVSVVSVVSPLPSTASSASDLTGGSLGTRL